MENAQLPHGMLEQGSGEPIVLFHGILGTPEMWNEVLPLLASRYRAIALPALGHQGGRRCERHPAGIMDVVDDAERALDALGIERAHLVGNSMGGWVALELSRRGRARSVCAFSPAGMWGPAAEFGGRKRLQFILRLTRATRWSLEWTSQFAAVRRFALRDNAVHGERVSADMLLTLADAALQCEAAQELLDTSDVFAPLRPSCPTHIVWAAHDRIFPPKPFAATARERIPEARHSVLEGVGHVPMLDNPELVARTILQQVASASEDLPHASV
jgi:pimeloyl-ACP methyl ester carboxylesterase